METKIGISRQLEEHQESLQKYLTRMAQQMEGTKQALSEEYVLQLIEEHYQRLQEQLQQMRPNTQETIEEENRSFIRSLVDYFVSLLDKANRALEWTTSECENLQKRWTTRALEGSQKINHSLIHMTEKVADKLETETTDLLESEMLEVIVDTEEPEEPEETLTSKQEKTEDDQIDVASRRNSMKILGNQGVVLVSSPARESSKVPLPQEIQRKDVPQTEIEPKDHESKNNDFSTTEAFGEAPPPNPYEEILTEVFLSEQTAPENVAPLVQAVQENTKETMNEIQEVITKKVEEESVILTPEKLIEILQEREANLLQTVQQLLDSQSQEPMQEVLQKEKVSTVSKIKEAYQDVKYVVKANTIDKVIQTKNQVALTLRKGVLHMNQKLYKLSVQLDEKLEGKISELKNPSLLEVYPDMHEAGFTVTVAEEPYLIRYTEEENQLMVTSKNNPDQIIPYTKTLTMDDIEETLRQSKAQTADVVSEEAFEALDKTMDF
ncbi:hypothetical protein ACII2U_002835 [Listeria monocytogenes]|nr:hypothetical protein [Listeria monocytogenes]